MDIRNEILQRLPPFDNKKTLVVDEQDTWDIMNEIEKAHLKYATQYDKIADLFWTGDVYESCEDIFCFLKDNVNYNIEGKEMQSVKSPSAIVATGILDNSKNDCKHYAQFIAGVLDALKRQGKKIDWYYRFANYKKAGKDPGHVFVVVKNKKGEELWIDPVLPTFDNKKPFVDATDKKVNTMGLYQISGVDDFNSNDENEWLMAQSAVDVSPALPYGISAKEFLYRVLVSTKKNANVPVLIGEIKKRLKANKMFRNQDVTAARLTDFALQKSNSPAFSLKQIGSASADLATAAAVAAIAFPPAAIFLGAAAAIAGLFGGSKAQKEAKLQAAITQQIDTFTTKIAFWASQPPTPLICNELADGMRYMNTWLTTVKAQPAEFSPTQELSIVSQCVVLVQQNPTPQNLIYLLNTVRSCNEFFANLGLARPFPQIPDNGNVNSVAPQLMPGFINTFYPAATSTQGAVVSVPAANSTQAATTAIATGANVPVVATPVSNSQSFAMEAAPASNTSVITPAAAATAPALGSNALLLGGAAVLGLLLLTSNKN